jgi:hypothetical protein
MSKSISVNGTFRTSWHVRSIDAIGGKAEVAGTSLQLR